LTPLGFSRFLLVGTPGFEPGTPWAFSKGHSDMCPIGGFSSWASRPAGETGTCSDPSATPASVTDDGVTVHVYLVGPVNEGGRDERLANYDIKIGFCL
jgi:hypothetical protein